MVHISDTGARPASLIWSVATLVARTGGSFVDLRVELRTALGREPELAEAWEACRIANDEVASAADDDVAVGTWMMLCRLAGRLQEAA